MWSLHCPAHAQWHYWEVLGESISTRSMYVPSGGVGGILGARIFASSQRAAKLRSASGASRAQHCKGDVATDMNVILKGCLTALRGTMRTYNEWPSHAACTMCKSCR